MIAALLAILAFQLSGEILSRGLHLPIPGPVLGMLLLVLGFYLSPRLQALVQPVARALLDNLLILFVPAGVGAAIQFLSLGQQSLLVAVAVIVSTVLAIVAGAAAFALVARLSGNIDDDPPIIDSDPARRKAR